MDISLKTVGLVFSGSVLAYAALRGQSVGDTVRALLGGKSPVVPQAYPIDSSSVSGTSDSATGSVVTVASSTNKSIGRMLASAYGWSVGSQWTALDNLWTRESGWNNKAENPSSGAYGIPQALPPTKMPYAAQKAGGSSPFAQVQWGLSYIRNRYGSPVNAWGHEISHGWY